MSQSSVDGFLERFRKEGESRKTNKEVWWSGLTHVQKAEYLISGVDPLMVFERDMPKLALAQIHATLALAKKK